MTAERLVPVSVGLLGVGKEIWSESQPPVAGKQLTQRAGEQIIEVLESTRQNQGDEREAALDSDEVTIAVWCHGSSSPDALQETSPLEFGTLMVKFDDESLVTI